MAWYTEQERIRQAEEARLRAEQAERERKERERQERLIAAQREREEAQRRAEQEARERAASAANEEARKEAEREAEKARKAAEAAAAKAAERQEAMEYAPPPPPITLATSAPKVKGQTYRKAWKARITDPQAAIRAIIEWPDWAAYLDIRQGEVDRFANRTKGNAKVAGIEMYEETILASASK